MTAGRGRPVTFDQAAQVEFLRLVASGVRIGDAADKLGISRRTPTQLAARNPGFAQRLAAAKAAGRDNRIPHGTAGGYNNHGCRGPRCTAAATAARTRHRQATVQHDGPDRTAQVHPLPIPQPHTATTKFAVLADVG
ncbi:MULTISPECIES: hypothetical protein [unclassified Streptomyces]|uniref:hypothetical protein n=1 Tax=unclassified Streptomyces TaxID=2593676 RepID=UPI0008836716|nr:MULTISPECIES: hypothetical protein [unclassified Streptomyces]PBC72343.1 hypothetical protein BX261_7427 [Streptomyces sp. 2321.6]SDR62108.1 hypothetical protein SAMN05216511_7276 [Streptomyces sp. KS_16]SEE50285.1 hypothetical protein SAMN05428940_7325 [Streptomyces sp. 2133.1]SNC77847.1 hypothetical protein SAMN06272741_7263 [Streptomyces sp. 2114.4]